jgi:hypothetical protein
LSKKHGVIQEAISEAIIVAAVSFIIPSFEKYHREDY